MHTLGHKTKWSCVELVIAYWYLYGLLLLLLVTVTNH